MTGHQFLVPADALKSAAPGAVVGVVGPEAHHAVAVLRVRPGEAVSLSDGAGASAEGVVQGAERGSLRVQLTATTRQPAADPRFVLVQALAKGDRGERAVEAATELGVDVVVPWQAARSVVRLDQPRADRLRQRWQAITVAAAKQSRRAWLPQIEPVADGERVQHWVAGAAAAFVLHGSAELALAAAEIPGAGDVVVVVGPEGGLADAELTQLSAAGGRVAHLGPLVLRTGTAGSAALAVLSAASRWR